MPRRYVLIAALFMGGILGFGAGHAVPWARAQDSLISAAAPVLSLSPTGAIPSNGTTAVTLASRSGTWPAGSTYTYPSGYVSSVSPIPSGLCACLVGNWISTSATVETLTVVSMPSGKIMREFLLPPTPANATMDSTQCIHGMGGESLVMILGAADGTVVTFTGDVWYRQGGN